MGGLGIIFNPLAGKNRKYPGAAQKLSALLAGKDILTVVQTEKELHRAVREFKRRGVDIIAISGGDGTIHLVLSAVVKRYKETPLPKFLALRSGTMNTFTHSRKLRGGPASILSRTLHRYRSGKPFREIRQHLLKINDKYGFMAGAGMVSNFLELYYSRPKPGPVAAAHIASKAVLSAVFRTAYARQIFRPTRLTVTIDGKPLDRRQYKLILGCTIKEIGLGFTPTPRAYDQPGCFHFVAANMAPASVVAKIPALWLGRDIGHRDMQHNGIAKVVDVEPDGELRWMVDGELYATREPLRFSVGPTITVLAP